MIREVIKFKQGRYLVPVTMLTEEKYLYFGEFGFNTPIRLELKQMDGAKWMGGDWIPEADRIKYWRVNNNGRNRFQLERLRGNNPYAKWDIPLEPFKNALIFERPLYNHQKFQVALGLIRQQCEIAAEMGLGKTLSAFEIMERSGHDDWWFVAPKSALNSIKLDMLIWKCKIKPRLMTYDELKKVLKEWPKGTPPPRGIICDESSRLKNGTAQRTQAVEYLAEEMRKYWGTDKCYIILMSGSPAPNNPVDLYSQIEIICPGWLVEGNVDKFKYNLAIFEKVEVSEGVTFPKLVAWRDGNPEKCNICGKGRQGLLHTVDQEVSKQAHAFIPMKDELGRLYRRLNGILLPQFKKDCLDLPEKIYKKIYIKPSLEILRAAKLIMSSSKSVISGLIKTRELSDGFQYHEKVERVPCPSCTDGMVNGEECFFCGGEATIRDFSRETKNVSAPKLETLIDVLEDFESRIVVFAAFMASIDLIENAVTQLGWKVIRVDGRGWKTNIQGSDGLLVTDPVEMLQRFQDRTNHEKIMFLAHPKSGGMSLTLTASKASIYYSNDYDGEARIQSKDRIHRIGMDAELGATIIDLIHLPTDELVVNALDKKQKLQSLTLGEIQAAFEVNNGLQS